MTAPDGGFVLISSGAVCPRIVNALGHRGRVQMHGLISNVSGELANRAEVIEDPERTPLSGDHEVIVLDDEIVNWDMRHI